MSKNTRNNEFDARLTAVETGLSEIRTMQASQGLVLEALYAKIVGSEPVALATPFVTGEVVSSADFVNAPLTAAVVKPEPKVEGVSFRDLRAALKAHKAAGAIKPGLTVKEAIAAGLMNPDGTLPTGAPKPVAVVAEVKAEVPAKRTRTVTEAEQARREAPRRADGTATPKREWALREQLAMTGKFDRFEIDAKVAEAYANPALVEMFGLSV